MSRDYELPPTIFPVPALAADTPELRDFSRLFPRIADASRNVLKVYNRSSETITIRIDKGKRFPVGDLNWVEINGEGPIRSYTVTAPGAVPAGLIDVYEDDEDEEDE